MKLDSIDVRWDWNATNGVYYRTMEGSRHMDRNSGQVSTNNVVVLAMEYAPGISGSPDAQTLGSGEAFVFTGGNYIHGTWTRNDIHDPFTLVADDGTVIQLQPGRTFIELPRQTARCRSAPPETSPSRADRAAVWHSQAYVFFQRFPHGCRGAYLMVWVNLWVHGIKGCSDECPSCDCRCGCVDVERVRVLSRS